MNCLSDLAATILLLLPNQGARVNFTFATEIPTTIAQTYKLDTIQTSKLRGSPQQLTLYPFSKLYCEKLKGYFYSKTVVKFRGISINKTTKAGKFNLLLYSIGIMFTENKVLSFDRASLPLFNIPTLCLPSKAFY